MLEERGLRVFEGRDRGQGEKLGNGSETRRRGGGRGPAGQEVGQRGRLRAGRLRRFGQGFERRALVSVEIQAGNEPEQADGIELKDPLSGVGLVAGERQNRVRPRAGTEEGGLEGLGVLLLARDMGNDVQVGQSPRPACPRTREGRKFAGSSMALPRGFWEA